MSRNKTLNLSHPLSSSFFDQLPSTCDLLAIIGLLQWAMSTLPSEFEETPLEFSEEAVRISRAFQEEVTIQHVPC